MSDGDVGLSGNTLAVTLHTHSLYSHVLYVDLSRAGSQLVSPGVTEGYDMTSFKAYSNAMLNVAHNGTVRSVQDALGTHINV